MDFEHHSHNAKKKLTAVDGGEFQFVPIYILIQVKDIKNIK